jgi:hypothetical protein
VGVDGLEQRARQLTSTIEMLALLLLQRPTLCAWTGRVSQQVEEVWMEP